MQGSFPLLFSVEGHALRVLGRLDGYVHEP
jgi:hypothetical protein